MLRFAFLGILAVPAIWAQAVSTAQISGIVQDSSGLSIAAAEVRMTQVETSLVRTTASGADGSYSLTSLPVGHYQLQVSKEGFAAFVQSGIVLEVNTNPVVNVTLKVGAVSEQVLVEAQAAMAETHANGIGQLIDNQRVVELPLNGRQVTDLIYLSGGAAPAPAADLNTNKNFPTQTISIAGGLSNGATYLLDGGTHNDTFNNLNLPLPFPDAMQEFKVETSAVPARYGYHSAGAVNVVTKSGTNAVHGDAFEFVRNYDFNARNFFQPARDSLKRNQFGGVLGGPILKNKLFLFGGYQGTVIRQLPTATTTFVPTQAMLNGDFTGFAACGNKLNAPFFTGNKIDPAQFNQPALHLLKYVPVASDPCGRYLYTVPNNSNENDWISKLDYQASANHSLFLRYLGAQYTNPAFYDGKNILTTTKPGVLNRAHSVVLGDTYVAGPSLVNSFHVTLNRTVNERQVPAFFSPTDIGVNVFSLQPKYTNLSITGAFGTGGATTNPGFFNSTVFQLADDLDIIRGAHQISLGVNYIHAIQNELNNQFSNGQYSFTGQTTGSALADFMIGALAADQQGNQQRDNERSNYIGLYVQDSWRVTPRLVVNAGLRWDPFIPMHHAFDWVSHFDLAAFQQGTKSQVYSKSPAGIFFPGDPGFPGESTSAAKYTDFAPRIGIVWDPKGDGKLTIRSSYGIFYDLPHLFFNVRFAVEPPWGASVTAVNPVQNGFTNPFANYPGGNPFPAILNAGTNQPFPLAGVFINYANIDTHPTYVNQWNFSIQKQLSDWLFSASYLGTQTAHLWTASEANPGVAVPGATTGNIATRRVLSLLNLSQGQYYGTIATLDDGGTASYQGAVFSAQRRLARNFSVLGNYTLSHCISDPLTQEIAGPSYVIPGNRRADRGNCNSDRRHIGNLSLVATSPKLASRALSLIASNWQLSTILRAQSGNFSTVTTGIDNALTGVGNQRPILTSANVFDPNPTVDHYLNKAAFVSPATGTYGNLGVFNIENPGILQVDMGLSRNFTIIEHQQLQIRWEVFNVPNRMNANAPVTALNNQNFGKIQTAADPRIMQFALKYTF